MQQVAVHELCHPQGAVEHYLHTSLADLLNMHIFMGTEMVIGSIVIQLDYAESYSLVSCGQAQSDLSHLPAQDGCLLYRLLTEPNSVNLENLTVDVFGYLGSGCY